MKTQQGTTPQNFPAKKTKNAKTYINKGPSQLKDHEQAQNKGSSYSPLRINKAFDIIETFEDEESDFSSSLSHLSRSFEQSLPQSKSNSPVIFLFFFF